MPTFRDKDLMSLQNARKISIAIIIITLNCNQIINSITRPSAQTKPKHFKWILKSSNVKQGEEQYYHSTGVHMTDICSNTRGVYNIIEMKNRHQRIHFHQHSKRLPYASCCSQYCNFKSTWSTFRPATHLLQSRTPLHLLGQKVTHIFNQTNSVNIFSR